MHDTAKRKKKATEKRKVFVECDTDIKEIELEHIGVTGDLNDEVLDVINPDAILEPLLGIKDGETDTDKRKESGVVAADPLPRIDAKDDKYKKRRHPHQIDDTTGIFGYGLEDRSTDIEEDI